MRSCVLAILLFHALISVSATTVDLTADRENLTTGEIVTLHLEIYPSEPVGGQFVLYRETEPRKYVLIHVFLDKPSCTSCAGEPLISGHLSSDYHYLLKNPGNYWAEANFGGVKDNAYFTVLPETTVTTSTTSSTTTITTSTTSSTTTTTTTVTTTTTTSTTLQGRASPAFSISIAPAIVLAVGLLAYLLWRSK